MRLTSIIMLAAVATAHAAITPLNLGFEDVSAPFPTGWVTSGAVMPAAGMLSPAAAQLAAGASVHQDFAAAAGDGLTSFTTSFAWMLAGSGNVATDTCRVRLRGNNNSGDLITLRLSPAGLQSYSNPNWHTDIAFTPKLGTAYTVVVVVGNLDGDAGNRPDYQLAISDGVSTLSGPIRTSWHSGANTTANNTTEGRPFETIRFESGAGNTLLVDNIALPGFPALPGNQLVANPDFETAPFPASWTAANGTISFAGLNGSPTAARLPYNSTASLSQSLPASPAGFTAEACFQIAGSDREQAFRWQLDAGGSAAIALRTTTGGVLQVNDGGSWLPMLRISDGTPFAVPANQTVRLCVIGRDLVVNISGVYPHLAMTNDPRRMRRRRGRPVGRTNSGSSPTAPPPETAPPTNSTKSPPTSPASSARNPSAAPRPTASSTRPPTSSTSARISSTPGARSARSRPPSRPAATPAPPPTSPIRTACISSPWKRRL
jgi:hypothetical protein